MIALAWPVPRAADGRPPKISDGWHMRSSGKFHRGTDIMFKRRPDEPAVLPFGSAGHYMPKDTLAIAAAPGRVVKSFDAPNGGWVVIDHGGGVETEYRHLAPRRVAAGQVLRQGAVVGTIGHNPEGYQLNHLHFAVKVNGELVDPEPYLRGARVLRAPGIGLGQVIVIGGLLYLGYRAVA